MIQYSLLGRTAASTRLKTTFRGLAPSPSSATFYRLAPSPSSGTFYRLAPSPSSATFYRTAPSPSSGKNQFCLRMGTELVPETLYSNELTRLSARENYIEFFYTVFKGRVWQNYCLVMPQWFMWTLMLKCQMFLCLLFLGAFAKLRKVTMAFVTSPVCPSIGLSVCLSLCLCPHGTTQLPLDGFSWNLIFEYFWKICRENSSFITTWEEWPLLYMKTYVHLWYYLAQFFLHEKNFRQKL
jgi:hypothetical protein